ncbi:hypothetical protein SAMN05443639_101429 [Stigmatella erecta]|uniref:Lipoprotein n=2 Tax=Stigmatella erecta TaxID=83460 RepID=A0A1H9ZW81_9BACT|nr:hypothetical protein SAMN05443639_101429 [Stigmatella erecta]
MKTTPGGPMTFQHCLLGFLALAFTGCVTAPRGPERTAEAYAKALEDNRLPQAYALTTGLPEGEAAFRGRYTDPAARRERAAAVRAGLPLLEGHAPALRLERRESTWRVVETLPTDEVKATLARFLNAAESTDWEKAWSLLSAPLRARYTPDRLREDYQREPLARERLRRARLALKGEVKVQGTEATLPLGAERAVRLVLEGEEYRVAAIE